MAARKLSRPNRTERTSKTRERLRAPAAPTRKVKRSVAGQMLDAQRTMWKTGVSVWSRGSKLTMAPEAAETITKTLQLGLKKLEDVFDQRVLDSLVRNSMPTPSELRALLNRVATLEALVSQMAQRRGKTS